MHWDGSKGIVLVGKMIHGTGKNYLFVTSVIDGCIGRTPQDFGQVEGIDGGRRLISMGKARCYGSQRGNCFNCAGRETKCIGFVNVMIMCD